MHIFPSATARARLVCAVHVITDGFSSAVLGKGGGAVTEGPLAVACVPHDLGTLLVSGTEGKLLSFVLALMMVCRGMRSARLQ